MTSVSISNSEKLAKSNAPFPEAFALICQYNASLTLGITSGLDVVPRRSSLHRIFTEEVDIWHEIMLYAWVFDTLRLRQTCRLFRDISYQRVLWCKFLRQSCHLHGVPPVTYTLSDMSSAEVEAAVTRPYQFEDRLSFDWGERAYTTNTIGLSTAQLNDNGDTNPPKWDASLDDVVETTTLVRGGRFLIGVHNETWLACWDLWGTSPTSVSGKPHEKRLVSEPLGIYPCKGKVTRIVTQQSANDDNELIIGVFYQPASGENGADNVLILSLDLHPWHGLNFRPLASTMLTITNRACWTLDGDLLLVAGVVGIVAIWNWREGTWAVAKLSLLENDGSDSTNEELRAVRYPRVTMVGPDLFAVNFATDNGLACHFLKLPTLFPSFEEAAEKVQRTQVARVHLSHTYLVGVFLPSWLPVSKGKVNTRVQMLIWNDLRMECQGRYISLVYDEPAPPELPRHLMRRRLARAASSDSGATDSDDDMLIDVCDDESTSSAIDALPLFSAWTDSAMSTAEPDAEPPSQLVASSAPADITLHQSPFVMLPRPGLFDETVSGRLACIGCEANVARSQIIDGPGSLCGSGASSSSSSSTAIGVLPRVVLGKCVGVKEFSYMDCWSGVMGVADLNVGAGEGMVLKTFVF